jgi:hypothetical protein
MKAAMKVIVIGIVPFVFVFSLTACDSRPDDVAAASWAKDNIPRGARVIEEVPAAGVLSRTNPRMYIIFEFKGQCFMMYNGYRRGTMVNINCPTGRI